MSVLAREVDAYQRALDAWQRQANRHNRKLDAYQQTLVRNDQGQQLVQYAGQVFAVDPQTGRLSPASPPQDVRYELTDLPGNPGILALRQNPIGTREETLSGAQRYQDPSAGEDYYFTSTQEMEGGVERKRVGPEWQVQSEQPGAYRSADDYDPTTYTLARDVGVYPEAPGSIEGFNRPAPQATLSQARRIGAPSLAQVEAGLIGEVIRGGGVKQGVPVYRPRSDR